MDKIFHSLAQWHQKGHKVSLAVVTKTWGSAPRRIGSLMAIADDGRFEGSVSGGCVEGEVIAEASRLAHSGGSKLLSFTVSSEQAWSVGLACGGQIEILVMGLVGDIEKTAKILLKAIAARQTGYLQFNRKNGKFGFTEGACQGNIVCSEAELQLPVLPKKRLMIVGAVHIAQHLAPMAIDTGYDVTIIDPRAAFTEKRTFGGAKLVEDWPDEYFKKHPLDTHTALVTITHDPKIDDAALFVALKSDAFYIGCLGSKKTHAARMGRLERQNIPAKTLSRIHGPVGLAIGAQNPAEIAISILAEITQVLRVDHAVS